MATPLPGLDVPVVDPQTGLMTQAWYTYFQNHQKLTQLPDVSTVAPTNGQTVRYNAASKLWVPGV
jgi:uncharacterized protein YfaQ (DUF2300 family)